MQRITHPNQSRKFTAIFIIFSIILAAVILCLFRADSKINRLNLELINSYNWQVEEKPVGISYISIPDSFDPVFSAYSEIVSKSGFDLYSYRGKRVTRYSYKVLNHRDSDSGLIRINVFVYKDNIIAADISSASPDGFVLSVDNTSGIRQK